MTPIEMYKAEDGRIFCTEEECYHYERYGMERNPETGEPKYIVPIGESLV